MRTLLCTHLSAALTLCALGACGDGASYSDGGSEHYTLTVVSRQTRHIGLRPGQARLIQIAYATDRGDPIRGAKVEFSIEGEAHGSTLSARYTNTSEEGIASAEIRASSTAATFMVKVKAARAPAVALSVQVNAAGFATLLVDWGYSGNTIDLSKLSRVEFSLYAGGSCTDAPGNIDPSLRSADVPTAHTSATFESLPVDLAYTVVVSVYVSDGALRARGCVELPEGQLTAEGTGHLHLQVADLTPMVEGVFDCTTEVTLPEKLPPLDKAMAPWAPLASCTHGAAQVLLDCLLDLLDPGDPADCIIENPASTLTKQLLAARGVLDSGCRTGKRHDAQPSLEALISTALEKNAPDQFAALATVVPIAKEVLTRLTLQSRMTISRTDAAGRGVASHKLTGLSLTGHKNTAVVYDLSQVATPHLLVNNVLTTLESWRITLAPHGFRLGLGQLLRAALADGVLVPSGLPGDSAKLVAWLARTVDPDEPTTCQPLDRLLCGTIGEPEGCVLPACRLALNAFAKRLDGGFAAMPKTGADLRVRGAATVKDSRGDMLIDRLDSGDDGQGWHVSLILGDTAIDAQSVKLTAQRR